MTFTLDRKGEVLDAVSNSAGITMALFAWLIFRPYKREASK
jgi:hypothetical protein